MQRKKSRHSTSLSIVVTILCVSMLIGIATVFLIHDALTKNLVRRRNIPKDFSLTIGGTTYSTPSASLIKESSLHAYAPLYTPLDAIVAQILPEKLAPNPLDETLLKEFLLSIQEKERVASIRPTIQKKGKVILIDPGKMGLELPIETAATNLLSLDLQSTSSSTISLVPTGKELTPDAIVASEARAKQYLGKSISLEADGFAQTLKDTDLFVLFDLPDGFSEEALEDLAQIVNIKVSTPPVEPELVVNGRSVTTFLPPRDGVVVDIPSFVEELKKTLVSLPNAEQKQSLRLPLLHTPPKGKLSEINSLGITERIGIGESAFQHSIPNRIHNVLLTAKKMNRMLVLPGEEFSFNTILGDVSARTGFRQAYVIKDGQTVLGDGGGVCQVSTTLFRALLSAGLPVTERRGHAYRVGYYEQNSKPGFDATVYAPHPDLRFTNDTRHAILINTIADEKNLTLAVELWGASDGRKAEIKNYRQWDSVPAPPPIYQDDPTLPPGKLKQIDYAAPGLKTAFDSVVTYPDGSVKTKTFQTNYTPWSAVYLRGI